MIEEIKKEINNRKYKKYDGCGNQLLYKSYVFKILNKYKGQDKKMYVLNDNYNLVEPKTLEQMKEELGDKFDEYMYKINIYLLNKWLTQKRMWEELKEVVATLCGDESKTFYEAYKNLFDYFEQKYLGDDK